MCESIGPDPSRHHLQTSRDFKALNLLDLRNQLQQDVKASKQSSWSPATRYTTQKSSKMQQDLFQNL